MKWILPTLDKKLERAFAWYTRHLLLFIIAPVLLTAFFGCGFIWIKELTLLGEPTIMKVLITIWSVPFSKRRNNDSKEFSQSQTVFEPSILDPHKAWEALISAKVLLGPLGIKTLDPSDWAYNGFYNNQDGDDKKTACSWNYHQGPEWLWVAAYYLHARLSIGKILGGDYLNEAIAETQKRLGNYYAHLHKSVWRSLPELTQESGIPCPDSCSAQAWSVGCLIEVCQILKDI